MKHNILIVEDDLTFATLLKTWLTKKGFATRTASSCASARKELESDKTDIVLCDMRLPDEDGINLVPWMRSNGYDTPLIIMTSYSDIQNAVNAMKSGACDYISKPIRPEELLSKINDIIGDGNQSAMQAAKPQKANATSHTEFIEGKSDAARQLYNYADLVAPTPMSVLINGASGTGKEYIAHRIHMHSKRADKPFVAIDCGSIPRELAASEFFGHIKGSFTGAIDDKTGAFVEADGGTLFLDEVGNLSYEVQVQLLRALQERRIRPIGSTKEIAVDVRLISATNENLPKAIEEGNFREDLFHRINEFTLQMPSLKDMNDDILLFANYFLDNANKELGRNISGFDKEASTFIRNYAWPGNLRQLKNCIKRATLLAEGEQITVSNLGLHMQETKGTKSDSLALKSEDNEKLRIITALQRTDNNKSKAAVLLGIDRKTLYNKLKLYDINTEE